MYAVVLVHPPQPGYISSHHPCYSVPCLAHPLPAGDQLRRISYPCSIAQNLSTFCPLKTPSHPFSTALSENSNSDQNIFSYICAGNPNEARSHAGLGISTWPSTWILSDPFILFFSWATYYSPNQQPGAIGGLV